MKQKLINKFLQLKMYWKEKIPVKYSSKRLFIKISMVFCGAFYPGGCLGILAKPDGNLSFGFFHAVRVAISTRQGHIGYVVCLLLIVVLIVYIRFVSRSRENEDERNFSYSAKGTYGTSRMATDDEFRQYLTVTDSALETNGIILGKTMEGKVVSIPKDSPYNRNIFVTGSQGSSKSVSISRNMIIQCVIRGESFFVTDPKGELCGDMVHYLYMHGYEVGLWNLSNRWNSDGWDILQEINGEEELEYVDVICHTIIQNTTGINSEAFFNDIEEVLLKALVLYVATVLPKEQHHFSTAYEMLLQESAASLDAKFFALPITHPARQSYNLFCQSPQNKGNAILGLGSRLKIFQDEAIKRMTGYPQIDLEGVAQKKTAIFCMASDTTPTYNMLNALMISMAFIKIMAYADRQPSRKCDVPVYFILDEMPNIGIIDSIQQKEATARSRDIGMVLMVQNLPQFQNRYPDGVWEELIGGCDFRLFLGCNETTTAEYYSALTGTATIEVETLRKNLKTLRLTDYVPELAKNSGVGQRAVYTPDEIMRFDTDELLLFIRGEKMIRLKKFPFFEHPEALNLRRIMPQEYLPAWRFENGRDISGRDLSYQSRRDILQHALLETERNVIKDSDLWGSQRQYLIEEKERMVQKYASNGVFPNGQAVDGFEPDFANVKEKNPITSSNHEDEMINATVHCDEKESEEASEARTNLDDLFDEFFHI